MLVYVPALSLHPLFPPTSVPPPFCPPHTLSHGNAALETGVYTLSILSASEPLRIATDSISREEIGSQPRQGSQTERRWDESRWGRSEKEGQWSIAKESRTISPSGLSPLFGTLWRIPSICLLIIFSVIAPYKLFLPFWI